MSEFIKSPLNYTGGKYKLLKEIIPLFPTNIDTFVDVFGGGGNIAINVPATNVIYNDIEPHITGLMRYLRNVNLDTILEDIDYFISLYSLSKENKEGYLALRNHYNEESFKSLVIFYVLICYSFNNQFRFNSKGEFNMPFGKGRSSFNPTLRGHFIRFVTALQKQYPLITNLDFRTFSLKYFNNLTKEDLVYCDPPYLNSTATYNEQGGWTEQDEKELLELLDGLNKQKIRFALSNNLKYNNPLLNEWKDKYNTHYLNADYSNCSYQKRDKSKDIEVLITNY